jgi:predicted nucleic acid-binding protein
VSEPEPGMFHDPGRVVSNAGPLITLATIGKLDLLKGLFLRVYIPEAV